jgi:hypothetical protein
MPGLVHEGPIELLRHDPMLAALLLASKGVRVPDSRAAMMAPGELTSALPAELRADAVIVLEGLGGTGKLAVVVESQTARDDDKQWVWPAYLALARAQHRCPAVLLVICLRPSTGRWARRPIALGHPGFELVPLVVDAESTPVPDTGGSSQAAAELAVLGALTGAIDLDQDGARRMVLDAVAAAGLEEERLETYTQYIRVAASPLARDALEALMTTVYKDEFVDRYKAEGRSEGRAEGMAEMVLRILVARGFEVSAGVRQRVMACTDQGQLEAWADRAVTASSVTEVFAA